AFILMVVALGVLNVGHEIAPHRLPWIFPAGYILLGLILLTAVLLLFGRTNNPLLFTFSDLLRDTIGNWIYGYLMVVAVLLGIALFFNAGDLNSLQFLMYSLVLVSFSFLFVVMARRNIAWINKDARVIKIICILAVSLSLCFLLINFIPSLSQHINPLICANLAFVFYLTLLYFFRILGVSLKSYIVFFFLLTALIVANVTTSSYHHEIDYATGEEARFQPDRRLDMREYLQRWVDDRAPQIRQYLAERRAADSTSNPRYPLLVISSEGGGSRSAYWTNIVHDYLDQQIPAYYDQHIFGLTGASGGNTGNSTYFSMKQAGVVQDSIHSYARQMFMGNFLSSSLTLLMGADLWRSTLGLKMGTDRAKQLEYEWTKQLSDVSQGQVDGYSDPFLNFWYESGDTRFKDQRTPPLLLLNTTHVQSGGHAIVSPVQLRANFYQAMDLLQVIDTMSRGKKTIRLSTANLLNASFPYINPAGNVKNVGSFVDAGYYDNYGAQSGRGILLHLRHLRDSMKQSTAVNADLYQQLVFYSILIRNGTVDPSPTRNTALPACGTSLGSGQTEKWLQHQQSMAIEGGSRSGPPIRHRAAKAKRHQRGIARTQRSGQPHRSPGPLPDQLRTGSHG
ncbi:MAG: NADH-quinone oxidoreductase subunit J, partial [Bacteroidota bacterium]